MPTLRPPKSGLAKIVPVRATRSGVTLVDARDRFARRRERVAQERTPDAEQKEGRCVDARTRFFQRQLFATTITRVKDELRAIEACLPDVSVDRDRAIIFSRPAEYGPSPRGLWLRPLPAPVELEHVPAYCEPFEGTAWYPLFRSCEDGDDANGIIVDIEWDSGDPKDSLRRIFESSEAMKGWLQPLDSDGFYILDSLCP